MQTLCVVLRFDGRAFCGWQVQKNGLSVMAVFQDALEAVLRERPDIKGCSRTDAGVHAFRYYVSFKTSRIIPPDRLVAALNSKLPKTVAAIDCFLRPEGFHARYSAVGKQYRYLIFNTPLRDPFWEGLALFAPKRLDAGQMEQQGQDFVGNHDFTSFCSAGSSVKDKMRTIYSFEVLRDGNRVECVVSGDGFLYNMVRIMVGTLLDIEGGRIEKGRIPNIIGAKNRSLAGKTAPACALYLDDVFYNETEL